MRAQNKVKLIQSRLRRHKSPFGLENSTRKTHIRVRKSEDAAPGWKSAYLLHSRTVTGYKYWEKDALPLEDSSISGKSVMIRETVRVEKRLRSRKRIELVMAAAFRPPNLI